MQYTTYVSGLINISGLPIVNKMQIRSYLEDIYTIPQMADIYSEEEVTIMDEWTEFDQSEKFLVVMHKIAKQLKPETSALIMCTGEREGDIWGIIIKNNRVFTQRFELKPDGNPEEYEKIK